MKNYFIQGVFIILASFTTQAQQVFVEQTSDKSYIYQISNEAALQLYKEVPSSLNETYYKKLVDSFPIEEEYTKKLPQGHYIQTSANRNIQESLYTSKQDFDVFVFSNAQDLIVQVYDVSGKLLDDVKVFVNNKQLKFNTQRQAYFEEKSNAKGILSVQQQNFTAYYHLTRTKNSSFVKRASQQLAYNYPTKYVWLPIEFVAMLPVDAVRSINRHRPDGKINSLVKAWERISCLWNKDNYYCKRANQQNYKVAYFVLNKPKFRTGDTLNGKFFVWDEKSKPLNQKLHLVLKKSYKKEAISFEIKPYRNGAYAFDFVLADSLDLKLDKDYFISIKDQKNNDVTSVQFSYEDYELSNNTLTVYTNKHSHTRGEDMLVLVDAKDANQKRLRDANVELVIRSNTSNYQKKDMVFITDTLWQTKLEIDPTKTTEIKIPDTIFPPADVKYTAIATLRTSDYDMLVEKVDVRFFTETNKITHKVLGDSIEVSFLKRGKPISVNLKVEAEDFFGNPIEVAQSTTPFTFPIEAVFTTYRFFAEGLEEELKTIGIPTDINALVSKKKDSIYISVTNPKKLNFYYSIFKGNTELSSGYSTTLNYTTEDKKQHDYHLNLNYIWGGKTITRNFSLPSSDKKLQVMVNQPVVVYPGQTTTVEVQVKDNKGNPVENADVTAFGLTSKFQDTLKPIQDYSTPQKFRKVRNSFNVSQLSEKKIQQDLAIDFWNDLETLGKKEFYQLSYPKNELFSKAVAVGDAPTQFAPFVVDNGKFVPIHIIYINKRPIYFSDMTNLQAYSFAVEEHPVHIQLRTKNKMISLDSISFKKEHKTILSLDINAKNKKIQIEDAPSELPGNELKRLQNYVMPYRLSNHNFSYLINEGRIHLLQRKPTKYNPIQLVGPITNRRVNFVSNNYYELNFNFEGNYLYQFLSQHLKQSPLTSNSLPTFFVNDKIPSLYDLVFTEKQIATMSEIEILKTKTQTDFIKYPYRTKMGNSTIRLQKEEYAVTQYLVNLSHPQASRIYKGSATRMYDLKPGNYRLFVLYANKDYRLVDHFQLQANGTMYIKIDNLPRRKNDSFSQEVSDIIAAHIQQRSSSNEAKKEIEDKLNNTYEQFQDFFGDYYLIEGKVTDENQLALPGVELRVEATDYGTQTDFDGYFQLRVPKLYTSFMVNYIGFNSQKIKVTGDAYEDIRLTQDIANLEEVIVTAYGGRMMQNASVQSEISALSNQDIGYINNTDILKLLQGQISGVFIQEISQYEDIEDSIPLSAGSVTTIIRGRSSLNSLSESPLVVINGVPFQGDVSSISPDLISSISLLKGTEATSIYGSRAAGGVIIITTNQDSFQVETDTETETEMNVTFISEASQANSIRNNFSDEAFWQNKLSTDKEGKLSFKVTYPDDVTSWDTHFLVATEQQQTGQISQNVKSFKPLMAQLNIPRFLIEGDTAVGIGKIHNYLKDSVSLRTKFSLNQQLQFENTWVTSDFMSENLNLSAPECDSLQITYQLSRDNPSYLDGEELTIPVFKKGMKQTEGKFFMLPKNEILLLHFNDTLRGDVSLHFNTSLNQLIEDELDIVINYFHECNEQIASRLKAELYKRKIYHQTKREIDNDKTIKKLIKLLLKNQKNDQLWGWWASSKTNNWASLQVIEALQLAKNEKFDVQVNWEDIISAIETQLFTGKINSKLIPLLQVLDTLDDPIDFKLYIEKLLQKEEISAYHQFQLWELLQKNGGELPWEEFKKFQKENALGNIYFESEDLNAFHPFRNSMQMSIIAYRILRKVNKEDKRLQSLRNYMLSQRSFNGYANTYQSISVIATLFEDVSFEKENQVNLQIKKNDSAWETTKDDVVEIRLSASDQVQISHSAALPIYVNYSQYYWNTTPKKKEDTFEIKTNFENKFGQTQTSGILEAGEVFTLAVEVDVKKQADYVMIEVPIPAGCSYTNKKQFQKEAHRSYAKDRTYIFVEQMNEGKHHFEIELTPRYKGSYTLNPATAKLMYYEHIYGNEELKRVEIVE